MATPSIQLTQSIANTLTGAEQSSWPLTIQALGTNMPSEVFVYQAIPVTDQIPGDRYQCVASVNELQELPTIAHKTKKRPHSIGPGEKLPTYGLYDIPYYRSDKVEFVCHTEKEAEFLWGKIQAEVQRLVDNLEQFQNLQTQNVATISPSSVNSPDVSVAAPVGPFIPGNVRFYNVSGQIYLQLLDQSSGYYYTLSVLDQSGELSFQINSPGYSTSSQFPYVSPGAILPSAVRFYILNGSVVLQLLDAITGLYHTVSILNQSGELSLQLSDQGY